MRIRVSFSRFRVPDVCVVALPVPDDQIFTQPPFICIEVISPDDTLRSLQDRFDDYLAMGVPNIWAVDPATPRAWRILIEGHFEALDGVLRTSDGLIRMPLSLCGRAAQWVSQFVFSRGTDDTLTSSDAPVPEKPVAVQYRKSA